MKCSNPACAREIPVEAIFKIVKGNGVARCLCKTETVVPFPAVKNAVIACLDEGVDCPACGQFAKRYKRPLNSGMAKWLVALIRLHNAGAEWAHISWIAAVIRGTPPAEAKLLPPGSTAVGSGDGPKGVHWGIVEDMSNSDAAKKDSGYWRATTKGRGFAGGAITLPKYSVLYNNVFERHDGDPVTIREVWGEHFNFQDLMNGVGTNPD